MPTTTSRLALQQPVGTDDPSLLRLSITNNTNTLDGAVTFSTGTLAARPAASLNGRIYYTTDTKAYYMDSGSVWHPLMVGGAWTNVTLPTGTLPSPSMFTPSARLVGDEVHLRGGIHGSGGGVAAGSAVCTMPSSSMFPSEAVGPFNAYDTVQGIVQATISTSGALTSSADLVGAGHIVLDGIWFSVA